MSDEVETPSEPARSTPGLLRHSLVYGLVPLIRNVTSAGMTRFYTHFLISALFGVRESLELGITLMQQLLGINLFSGMTRIYFDRKTPEERASVITSTTLFVTAAAWLVCAPALFFTGPISRILIGQPTADVSAVDLSEAVRLLLLLIPFQLSTTAGMYYLQTLKRSSLYSTIQTAKLALEVCLHLYFMGHLGLGLRGFLYGLIGGELVTSLFVTGWMLIKLKPRFEWSAFMPVLAYAAPLIPVGFCQFGLHQINRRLIEHSFSGAEGLALTGIFGLGYKVGYLINAMMLGPFLQIWHPWIYDVADEHERASHVARVTTWAVLAIGTANLVVICGARELVHVLSGRPEYHAAYKIVPWISAGYVFWALYNTSQIPLYIAKRTTRIFWINLIALVFNVLVNLWLIERFAITGAAIATFLTFVVLALLGMLASKSEAHVPFEVARLMRVLAVVVAGAAIMLFLEDRGGEAFTLSGMAMRGGVLVGLLCVMWLGVLKRDERDTIRGFVATRLGLGDGGRSR